MDRAPYDISPEEERSYYEQGIQFFNERDYFEAHEVWEQAWNGTSGQRHQFYHGLIQMAVALVHMQRGNRLGVEKVFERAIERWAGLPDRFLGLDLRGFENRMRHLLVDVLGAPPGTPVRFDPSRLFEIRLEWAEEEEAR